MVRVLLAALLAAAVLGSGAHAHAAPRVLVIAGPTQDARDAKVLAAVRTAVDELPEVTLLPPPVLDLEAVQLAIDCTDASERCMAEVAGRMHADFVIVPVLKRRSDALELNLSAFHGQGGEPAARAMRRQAGTKLAGSLLDAVPSMVREVLRLTRLHERGVSQAAEDAEPAPEPASEAVPPGAVERDAVEQAAPQSTGAVLPLGPLLVGGAGLALITAGLITGAIASGTESDYAAQPVDTIAQAERADALRERGQREALAANVLLGAGATALIAAAVWYVLDAPAEAGGEQARRRRSQTSARVQPVVSPDGAFLWLSGTWETAR